MTTFVYSHSIFADHDTGIGHPECQDRAVIAAKAVDGLTNTQILKGEAVNNEALIRVHNEKYLSWLKSIAPVTGYVHVDADSIMSPHSYDAMMIAAGAGIMAVDAVMKGVAKNAFIGARPPGHHANSTHAMGFCFINNVAVAAEYARYKYGLKRVAVLDFDVHHGNGTEDIFRSLKGLFYGSSHQHPAFPGTGLNSYIDENVSIINVPMAPGSGTLAFRQAWDKTIFPELNIYQPDLILVSAGFDAHIDDPLAQINLKTDDYIWITERIMDRAHIHCQGRIISLLEGGYNLPALHASIRAHVQTLATYQA